VLRLRLVLSTRHVAAALMFKDDFDETDLVLADPKPKELQERSDECMRGVLNELESNQVCGTTELAILLQIAISRNNHWASSLGALLNSTFERSIKSRNTARNGGSVHVTYPVS
jgi:hypothetical protein